MPYYFSGTSSGKNDGFRDPVKYTTEGLVVSDGLITYLDASNSRSYPGTGITWIDLSGSVSVNNVTLYNGPTYSSDNGGSIVFDGVNDYGSFARKDFNTSLPNFTISASIYKSADGIILGNHFHNSTWESVWFSTTQFTVNGNNNTTNRQTLSYTTPNNSWMNLVAVNNSSQNYMKVFLNGVELASMSVTVVPWSSFLTTYLATQLAINTNATVGIFSGRMAQVLIYNKALSTQQIQQNFNAIRGRFGI